VFTVSSAIWRCPHTLILFNMIYKNDIGQCISERSLLNSNTFGVYTLLSI
jgi:hypothetical protein